MFCSGTYNLVLGGWLRFGLLYSLGLGIERDISISDNFLIFFLKMKLFPWRIDKRSLFHWFNFQIFPNQYILDRYLDNTFFLFLTSIFSWNTFVTVQGFLAFSHLRPEAPRTSLCLPLSHFKWMRQQFAMPASLKSWTIITVLKKSCFPLNCSINLNLCEACVYYY